MIKSQGQRNAHSYSQQQHKKKIPHHKKREFVNNSNNNNNNSNHLHYQKKSVSVINSIDEFQKAVINCSLDYPLPKKIIDTMETQIITDLPKISERRPAQLSKSAKLLGPTYIETSLGHSASLLEDEFALKITKSDIVDPIAEIILNKRSKAKQMKLGATIVDIYKKHTVPSNKIINKLLQKDSLSTPFKRIRDELVDASSSVKKNKRMSELQNTPNQSDTTMELSFEGKAMDKNEFVKLVDDSEVLPDESVSPDFDTTVSRINTNANFNLDTRNLLQNTEFSFEFRAQQ